MSVDDLLKDLGTWDEAKIAKAAKKLATCDDDRVIPALGKRLLLVMDHAVHFNGSSIERDSQIRKSDRVARVLIKALGKTKKPEASEYLLEAYSHKFPDALYYPNGACGIASPCWMNVHLDTLLRCEINRTLGLTGGQKALNHLLKVAQRGYGIGQGMSWGSWYPSSAIEGLGILGDKQALGILKSRLGSAFISDDAKESIELIESRLKQKEQLKKANKVKFFDTWVELEPDELEYDSYKVTKFINYVFGAEYRTEKEREAETKRWGHGRGTISYPEDRALAEADLSDLDIKVVKKYLENKKKKSIPFRLGMGSLTRLSQIENDLNEFFKKRKT